MKHLMLMVCAILATAIASASDWTITESTTITGTVTYDNIYADADVALGTADTVGNLTINSSKYVYLPNTSGKSATFTYVNGDTTMKMAAAGNTAGFYIGKNGGSGKVFVQACNHTTVGRFEVWPSAQAAGGYVDFLQLSNGLADSGNWFQTKVTKILNRRTDRTSARILFKGKGGALAPNGANMDGSLFWCGDAGACTVLEGDGADIVFVNGSWISGTPKAITLLQRDCNGVLKTQGDCNVVFHNHSSGSNPEYVYQVTYNTNQIVWAHSGKTIISNACTLKVSKDYALPNGPQTGSIEFGASGSVGLPTLDLAGTTQIVNGLDTSMKTEYNGELQCRVVNSSANPALLIFGAHDENGNLNVGRVASGVSVRKVGEGTLSVNCAFLGDIEVVAGAMRIAKSSSAGAILVSGGQLIVDGCILDCTSIGTSGTGKVVCRNGGQIIGAELNDTSFEVSSVTNTSIFCTSRLGGTGRSSFVKTGNQTLTLATGSRDLVAVDVQEGALRIGGTFYAASYWRYTFSKTTNNVPVTVRVKDGESEKPLTFTPGLMLNRLHHFGCGGEWMNGAISYAGLNLPAEELAAGKCTANMGTVSSEGFGTGTVGGVLAGPGTLHAGFANSFAGTGFTNGNYLAENNKLVYTFRHAANKSGAAGYLFVKCVNCEAARPLDWTVETSEDGVTWQTVDERVGTDAADKGPAVYGHGGVPYLFRGDAANWMFKPSGVVRVAAGATLDTTEIDDENVSIAKLETDMAVGAGTITKFVPAANGEIRLVNVTGELDHWTGLYDVGSVVDADNLKSWAVYVNGSATKDFEVRVRDGKICVHRLSGLILVVR